jgi:hypothetical protein
MVQFPVFFLCFFRVNSGILKHGEKAKTNIKEFCMKNRFNVPLVRLFGIIALVAVIGFSMAACGGDDDSGDNPQTVTYTGTSGGVTYTLKITENTARYAAQSGDSYELTVGSKKSKGTVQNVTGDVLTLKPSNAETTFTATVSGSGLTAMNGTIAWTEGEPTPAPGEMTGGGEGGSNMIWTEVADSTFNGAPILAIAYGNNKFVAGGNGGDMAYSSDGITWTALQSGTINDQINSIAFGDNKFVMPVNDTMAYSTDGITWTTVRFGTNDRFTIAYGNGKFVAGGRRREDSDSMVYSSDGVTWTAVADSTFTSDISEIAFGNDKFVAVGASGKIAYSTDGITWTSVADSTFGTNSIDALAYGNNKFVAGGRDGKIAYSSDGITWTAVANSTFGTSTISAIAYGNNEFVAGGSSGKMATSSDGTTWTAVANSTFGTSTISAIAYGNNKFVAGSWSGKIAYSTGN